MTTRKNYHEKKPEYSTIRDKIYLYGTQFLTIRNIYKHFLRNQKLYHLITKIILRMVDRESTSTVLLYQY